MHEYSLNTQQCMHDYTINKSIIACIHPATFCAEFQDPEETAEL